ncbi:MAG: PAS domain S-box protein [Bryobacterales bacterium]|nr:PAS domain S-box protein [Bryobacterales bacterium]
MKRTGLRDRLNRSLMLRMLLFNFLVLTASTLVLIGLFLVGQRQAMRRELGLRGNTMANLLARQAQVPMVVGDKAELRRLAELAGTIADIALVEIGDGRTVVRAGVAANKQRGGFVEYRDVQITQAIEGPKTNSLMEWEGSHKVRDIGQVRLVMSGKRAEAAFVGTVRTALLVGGAALGLLLTFKFAQVRSILRPVGELIQATDEVGKGNLAHRATVERMDEVGRLASAFNEMTARLSTTTVSKAYVDNILQSMAESLIVTDASGLICEVNPAALRLLGYTHEALTGQPISLILPGYVIGSAGGAEHAFLRSDGTSVEGRIMTAPLSPRDGEDPGWVLVGSDLTEIKRTERELIRSKEAAEAANVAKSAFLANMTHELRTPLNAVINFAQLLEEELEDRQVDELLPDVRKITTAGKHLLGIVSEVLDLSKIEAGRMEVRREPFSVEQIVQEVVQTAGPLAEKNGNRLEIAPSAQVGIVESDEQKFRQSLLNLVSNACKFTQSGQVTVQVAISEASAGTMCSIHVSDTGIGIHEKDLARLFRPFEQVDATAGRRYGGTGLGLAISRRFCQMMGGDLEVESQLGKGSTFTMSIPTNSPATKRGN